MASRTVLIAVDDSEQAEYAFECKLFEITSLIFKFKVDQSGHI